MKIAIKKVPIEQKQVLRNLMELYQYDFSELSGDDVNEHGLFDYRYLDLYWIEEKREPFIILVDNNIAGFVLVNGHLVHSTNPNTKALAEFFILRKYRRRGIGKEVAQQIFSKHTGPWEVTVNDFNTRAFHFWKTTIAAYTKGDYQLIEKKEDSWTGFVFLFDKKKQ